MAGFSIPLDLSTSRNVPAIETPNQFQSGALNLQQLAGNVAQGKQQQQLNQQY